MKTKILIVVLTSLLFVSLAVTVNTASKLIDEVAKTMRAESKGHVCCEGLPKHTYEMTPAEKTFYKVK